MAVDYELEFEPKAQKELYKLDGATRMQLLRKLAERLHNPRVPGDALHGHGLKNHYKIKLRSVGYRLVYRVEDERVVVVVVSVGKRERNAVYEAAKKR